MKQTRLDNRSGSKRSGRPQVSPTSPVMTALPRPVATVKTVASVVTATHGQRRCPARVHLVSSAVARAAWRTAACNAATGSARARAVARQRASTLPTDSPTPSRSAQTATTSRRLSRSRPASRAITACTRGLELLGLPSPHWLDALGYGRTAAASGEFPAPTAPTANRLAA